VYADVLCRCINKNSVPCVSRRRRHRAPTTADNDDEDDGRTTRRAVTTAGAETAAMSTIVVHAGPLSTPSTCSPRSRQCPATSIVSTTVMATIDDPDVIEMKRMDQDNDLSPIDSV